MPRLVHAPSTLTVPTPGSAKRAQPKGPGRSAPAQGQLPGLRQPCAGCRWAESWPHDDQGVTARTFSGFAGRRTRNRAPARTLAGLRWQTHAEPGTGAYIRRVVLADARGTGHQRVRSQSCAGRRTRNRAPTSTAADARATERRWAAERDSRAGVGERRDGGPGRPAGVGWGGSNSRPDAGLYPGIVRSTRETSRVKRKFSRYTWKTDTSPKDLPVMSTRRRP